MAMTPFITRMRSLGMSETALARRCRLPVDVVRATAADPMTAHPDDRRRVAVALGLRPDGTKLVGNRTFRKQQARKQAARVAAMVQGTMGLESQGLTPVGLGRVARKSYARILRTPGKLW
jgi:hypothetical protein